MDIGAAFLTISDVCVPVASGQPLLFPAGMAQFGESPHSSEICCAARKPGLVSKRTVVGVISDTHGLLRPAVLDALADCQIILHAGDVGEPDVLEALRRIAPVVAVRGNTDRDRWADRLGFTEMVEFGGKTFYLLHDVHDLDLVPGATGIDVVISGHSHRPSVGWQTTMNGRVLFLNPGSAGPRRFNLPISLARVHLADGQMDAEIVELEPPAA